LDPTTCTPKGGMERIADQILNVTERPYEITKCHSLLPAQSGKSALSAQPTAPASGPKQRAAIHMRRLSGLDSLFLNLEMPRQPMQVIALAMLRACTGDPLPPGDLRRHLAARLDQLPAFRWRVVPVPLGLANALFIEDPDFDLDAHLRHMVLPEPGGTEELDAACGRLVSQHLARNRPLWRVTLIDGLADGRQALLLEVHHALMDGFATAATLARIFSEEQPPGPPAPRQPGRMPGRVRLITGALAHHVQAAARLPGLIGRTRRARTAVRQQPAEAAVRVPKAGVDVPPSAINSGLPPVRRFARAALPLDAVLLVKDIAGVTVNDVALALIGGALRSFLIARGALPDRPLVASVPVGMTESGSTPRADGNRVSFLHTSLGTDIADPWERLTRVSVVTTEAKRRLDLEGRELLDEWLGYLPPVMAGPIIRRSQVARHRPGQQGLALDANAVVSNLRGPSTPWRLGSAAVEEVYLAPPGVGVGVNFLLWDYAGRLLFGILSYAEAIENPRELAGYLSGCLDELVTAAECRRVPIT
jgi:diacylglycerol O-acyltransferase